MIIANTQEVCGVFGVAVLLLVKKARSVFQVVFSAIVIYGPSLALSQSVYGNTIFCYHFNINKEKKLCGFTNVGKR